MKLERLLRFISLFLLVMGIVGWVICCKSWLDEGFLLSLSNSVSYLLTHYFGPYLVTAIAALFALVSFIIPPCRKT